MLQQTQTDRVVPKYKEFLKKFPTVRKLAKSNLREVLAVWKGLGYNRRAKFLLESAQTIISIYKGKIPNDYASLRSLRGIGDYTAKAILAFAFSQPTVCIETNIRSVFTNYYFKKRSHIDDKEILPLIEKTLYSKDPKNWYYALMDKGAELKRIKAVQNSKSKHYVKQSRFKGSHRELRGKILAVLLAKKKITISRITKMLKEDPNRVEAACNSLLTEKLIQRKGRCFTIYV